MHTADKHRRHTTLQYVPAAAGAADAAAAAGAAAGTAHAAAAGEVHCWCCRHH